MSVYKFPSKGSCETTIIGRGEYMFEVWGAQGGTCDLNQSARGGYSRAVFKNFFGQQQITVCVGSKGSVISNRPLGGFNGGGNAHSGIGFCAGGGGGATDIRLGDENGRKLIIAGGGGGLGSWGQKYLGGFGGGASGGRGDLSARFGSGATQTSPGKGGFYEGGGNFSPCYGQDGELGKGGDGNSTANAGAGGGGGGYYGGGGGADYGSGGGGSGYIDQMLSKGSLFNGTSEFFDPFGTLERGHIGDGFAIIRKLNICSIFRPICHPHIVLFFVSILSTYYSII